MQRWVEGSLGTFEYLCLLNEASGRTAALTNDHYVFPWVSDLRAERGGWRDLGRTKFRLAKGDEMLDRTFGHARHHVPEPGLSELALCIYLARRAPLSVLRRVVRANFVPAHYPASVERLYAWSPDECIPEFFCGGRRGVHFLDSLPRRASRMRRLPRRASRCLDTTSTQATPRSSARATRAAG